VSYPPIAGDQPPGYTGLPRPPLIPGSGMYGMNMSWAQVVKALNETLPYLARRLAYNIDRHRGSGAI
jgi:hypothetical protein